MRGSTSDGPSPPSLCSLLGRQFLSLTPLFLYSSFSHRHLPGGAEMLGQTYSETEEYGGEQSGRKGLWRKDGGWRGAREEEGNEGLRDGLSPAPSLAGCYMGGPAPRPAAVGSSTAPQWAPWRSQPTTHSNGASGHMVFRVSSPVPLGGELQGNPSPDSESQQGEGSGDLVSPFSGNPRVHVIKLSEIERRLWSHSPGEVYLLEPEARTRTPQDG